MKDARSIQVDLLCALPTTIPPLLLEITLEISPFLSYLIITFVKCLKRKIPIFIKEMLLGKSLKLPYLTTLAFESFYYLI